jgi:hypothetical protein
MLVICDLLVTHHLPETEQASYAPVPLRPDLVFVITFRKIIPMT